MPLEIVPLPKHEPYEGLADILEKALAGVRSGEVRAIALVELAADDLPTTRWAADSNVNKAALIGGIAILHRDIIESVATEAVDA